MNLASKIGNGTMRKVAWISVTIISTIAASIFLAGGKYSYVMSSCDKVRTLEKDLQEMKFKLAVIDTNVVWICKNMEQNERDSKR